MRRSTTRRPLMLALAAWAGVTALGPHRALAQVTQAAVRTDSTVATALRPGDVLRLHIWLEPDWSGDFPIDEKGFATLPRLGPTQVTDVATDALEQRLVERYREYLNNPSIEVIPLRRISIIGAVRNPGLYPIEPSVTLGQVTAIAGGQMPESRRNVLELRRGAVVRRIDLGDDPRLAELPLRSDDQVYVPERSWLSRNAQWVVSTLVGVAGTTVYLLTR